MGDYETDAYIKEIIAKYGRASVSQIKDDLGRYYNIRYTQKRVRDHCVSLARYKELRKIDAVSHGKPIYFEVVE